MDRRLFLKTGAIALAANAIATPVFAKQDALIKYGGSAWLGHYPAYLAMTEGFFRAEGIEQDWQSFGTSSSRMSAVMSGGVDVACTGIVSALALMARGAKHFSIIAIPESFGRVEGIIGRAGVTSLDDLKGKKIGVTFASSAHLLVLDVLANHGLTQDDVVVLNVPAPELPAALESGQIDAAAAWTPQFDNILRQEGTTLLVDDTQFSLYQSHNVTPGPDVLVVRNSYAEKNPDTLKKYLTAYFQANKLIREQPEVAAQSLIKLTNLPVAEQVAILQGTDWYSMEQQQALLTGSYAEGLQRLAELLVEHKQIDKAPVVKDWINTSFI